MKFSDSTKMATAHAYLIEWWPEDWPIGMIDPAKTYVAAKTMDEAISRLTTNPYDVKRVTVLGDIIESAPVNG